MSTPPESPPESEVAPRPQRLWLHLLLFGATFVTTTLVGLEMSNGEAEAGVGSPGGSAGFWLDAFSYSLSIMAILTAHEMGHYITARRRGVPSSMPYFIPIPFGLGTFGAFIRMRQDRQIPAEHLLRIAAYGPLAGLAVVLPVLGVGLALSHVGPVPPDLQAGATLGDSLLLWLSQRLIFGDLPPGMDVWLHPMAFAGWAGLLLTAVNLFPLSQLDGGHIAYTLLGRRFEGVSRFVFAGLVVLALAVYWPWVFLCVLLALFGVQHPPLCSDTPVRSRRTQAIGWITLAFFVLCFTPAPIGGQPSLLEALLP